MSKRERYSPEVRQRAVRMVFEHQDEYSSQWAAMGSIATKIGCTYPLASAEVDRLMDHARSALYRQ